MKYMTFRASCSFAGIANMLAQFGVDTEDRTIALGMGLPWLFARENGSYLAGPMLQSARWFNLYLHPIGFHLEEQPIPRSQAAEYLRRMNCAMLGLHTGSGKHAVVYLGEDHGLLRFLNNKWENSDEPEEFTLSEQELCKRTDDPVMIASLRPIQPKQEDPVPLRRKSCMILRENLADIQKICEHPATVRELRGNMDSLFRALLLDAITMLELIGEEALASQFTRLQVALLAALRLEPEITIRLGDYLSAAELEEAVEAYIRLIGQA